ncbi:hypothetical protein GWI33_005326 [Rhynchophorus ferrugineus]|uniref:Uncharacterized protein n=1 Tax=Rhynchophorus ferrugineus TaxID=354439 RepID=A0A834ICJ4_RHYFE|nr:hypothetical protein GWI33_011656 [Rhynchophorus ferrugineus]KAF7286406.1 hypothetical protein GWI33_005326 [Rhynchophorus ferrugineus]
MRHLRLRPGPLRDGGPAAAPGKTRRRSGGCRRRRRLDVGRASPAPSRARSDAGPRAPPPPTPSPAARRRHPRSTPLPRLRASPLPPAPVASAPIFASRRPRPLLDAGVGHRTTETTRLKLILKHFSYRILCR